jgi:hypothetical protein
VNASRQAWTTAIVGSEMARSVKANKYGAKKKQASDGTLCDSTKEARRWDELRMLKQAGVLVHLEPHPRYEFVVNGVLVGHFTPDSHYITSEGECIVEDVKAKITRTEAYMLRKRLFAALHAPLFVTEY